MALLNGIASFFLESTIQFIRQKKLERILKFDIGKMFALPYLRIIPMHLVILLPAFFRWEPSIIFLILKMVADILSFFLYAASTEKKLNDFVNKHK
jgi:hypothetical protein